MPKNETAIRPAPAAVPQQAPSFTHSLIEPLSRLRGEVDRLFDDFPFRLPVFQFASNGALAVPAVEMTETAKAYKITAELPGMGADDVEVSIDDGMLRIAGEKKEEREENERGYRLSERSYGAFERLIELPAAADETKMKARVRDGVLTVTVPKDASAPKQVRRIAVEKD